MQTDKPPIQNNTGWLSRVPQSSNQLKANTRRMAPIDWLATEAQKVTRSFGGVRAKQRDSGSGTVRVSHIAGIECDNNQSRIYNVSSL